MWRPVENAKGRGGPVRTRSLEVGEASCIALLLRTLSLWLSVVQVFCILPMYIQPFLRKTIGTREWPL